MSDLVKTIFLLLFSFKGKIKRAPFIYGMVFLLPLFFLFMVPFTDGRSTPIAEPMMVLLSLASIYCFFALAVKRLRDCNLSPWLCLFIYLVPGLILLPYLFFKPSVLPREAPKPKHGFLKNILLVLFSFKGKIKRVPFICGMVFNTFTFSLFVYKFILPLAGFSTTSILIDYILLLLVLAFIYCFFALVAKRLRDCNLSPWLGLIMFFQFLFLYLVFKPSVLSGEAPKSE